MTSSIDISHLIDALTYVKQFSGKSVLIKLGGSILHDPHMIRLLCEDLSLLKATGMSIVIVHGGGKAISCALEQAKINSEFLDGLRVTTPEAMDVIEMVLCGHINSLLVRQLNALGVEAVGLSGADQGMLMCEPLSPKYGEVGQIKTIATDLLDTLLTPSPSSSTSIPIIAPIGIGPLGQALNINADVAASALALSMNVEKLIYLTDQEGIKGKHNERLSTLYAQDLRHLIQQGTVCDGMLTKVNAVLQALEGGIHDIHIINGKTPHSILTELFTAQGIGTVCKPDP